MVFSNFLNSQEGTDFMDITKEEKYNIRHCSNCSLPVMKYFRYCIHCGVLMPLPNNVEELDIIEKWEKKHIDNPDYYHFKRSELGWKFCPYCREKLYIT